MIPKEAIEKAIEGGWKPLAVEVGLKWIYDEDGVHWYNPEETRDGSVTFGFHEIALDKTFWQSLGKALGKEGIELTRSHENWDTEPWWQYAARRFYDLILTGGDIEKFWNEVLPANDSKA